jgi:transposase-like protein
MLPLPMRCLIEKVGRFASADTVRLTGPTELDLTMPDQEKFVICNHTIEQDYQGVKQRLRPTTGLKTFAMAARFCHVFDEIRAFLHPQPHRNQPLTLAQRRDIHQARFAHLLELVAAA